MTVCVWLVTVGEPLPDDPGDPRLHRTGMLANELVRRGHQVVWWTSTFDHFNRVQRSPGVRTMSQSGGTLELVVLKGPGYRSDASVARFADHTAVAARFLRQGALRLAASPPAVVVSSLPTLELCETSRRLAQRVGRPYLVDVRDLWPDIFLRSVPKLLRPMARPALWPYRRMAIQACRGAAGIVGISDPILEWGQRYADRPAGPFDITIPLGYPARTIGAGTDREAERFWEEHDVGPSTRCATFLGDLSDLFDFDVIMEAANRLATRHPNLRVVICGKGPLQQSLQRRAASIPNVVVPGWIGRSKIDVLLSRSIVGLAPYVSNFDFKMSIPNKVPEYLSAGLPVMTSLAESESSRLLEGHRVGHVFRLDDPQGLADALEQILHRSPSEAKYQRRRCLALYESRFRADIVYSRYSDHIEAVAALAPVVRRDAGASFGRRGRESLHLTSHR